MKARKVEVKIEKHCCGECALGVWVADHRHYDMNGKPICLKCKHQQFYVVRSQHACEHFIKRK